MGIIYMVVSIAIGVAVVFDLWVPAWAVLSIVGLFSFYAFMATLRHNFLIERFVAEAPVNGFIHPRRRMSVKTRQLPGEHVSRIGYIGIICCYAFLAVSYAAMPFMVDSDLLDKKVAFNSIAQATAILAALLGVPLSATITKKAKPSKNGFVHWLIKMRHHHSGLFIGLSLASIMAFVFGSMRDALPDLQSFRETQDETILFNLDKQLESASEGPADRAKRQYYAAASAYSQQNYHDAAIYYERSIRAYPTIAAYTGWAYTLQVLNNFSAAENAFHDAIRLAETTHDRDARSILLQKLTDAYQNDQKYPEMLKTALQAEKQLREDKKMIPLATALYSQGTAYYFNKDSKNAFRQLNSSLAIYREQGDEKDLWRPLSMVGTLLSDGGHAAEAIKSWKEAYNLSSKCKDYEGMQYVSNELATAYIGAHDWGQAKGYAQSALFAAENTQQAPEYCRTYAILVVINFKQAQLPDASDALKEVTDLQEKQFCNQGQWIANMIIDGTDFSALQHRGRYSNFFYIAAREFEESNDLSAAQKMQAARDCIENVRSCDALGIAHREGENPEPEQLH